jgi:GMP synthase (glutamine-hydrolysing)
MQSEGRRVVAIQHVAAEPPGAIGRALEAAGLRVDVIRVDRGAPVPRDLGDAAGLVVMGGPMGVYEAERYPHLTDELALIQDAVKRERPVLGICLGSQLLAAALGARVYPGGQKEIGWYPVHLTGAAGGDPLFAALPAHFTALHWHGDVFELPPEAVWLAYSEMTPHQVFRHGRAAYGLLFHLEVSAEQVTSMSAAFAGELAGAGVDPAALEAATARHGEGQRRLGDAVFARWAQLARAPALR